MTEKRRLFAERGEATVWRIAALLSVISGSALSGCAAIGPYEPASTALAVPQSWSASPFIGRSATTSTSLAHWWTRFNDQLLVDLIDDALSANTSIVSARAALTQSRALADVQAAGLLPGLRGSASAQKSRSGLSGGNNSNAFKAGFDASWEPDVFGGQHAAVSAAVADTEASLASLGSIQISIAAEVATNYLQLRSLQTRLAIAASNLKSQEETLQITQWRTQAGLATSLDVEQARAATAQTRAQIPALRTAAQQAEHGLAVLTWRAPAALHDRLSATTAPATTVMTPNDELVLAFPAETLRQRPDIRAAETRVTAASLRVRQADAARYPSFQLSGSLGLSALTLGTLTHGSSVIAALLGSVSAPIFDGGAARAQVRAQQAAFQQAAAAYDASILAGWKDVEDSLVALSNDRDRLQSLRIAVEAAQSAAQLASQRYQSGLIDFQVVLETERTLLTTQDGVASTVADINSDHVRLYKALGGGWEATTGYPDASAAAATAQSNKPSSQ